MKKKLLCLWLVTICMLTGCGTNEEEVMNDSNVLFDTINDSESETTVDSNETNEMNSELEYDLNAELAEVEAQSEEFKNKLQDDITQMELNQTASNWYTLWDDELNSLWSRISDTVDVDAKSTILAEQRTWITDKEAAVAEAGADYEGGSMQDLIEYKKAAKLTRARCYVLAAYLGEAIGQTVEPFKIDYAGRYVDTQGTMESYSNLYITEESDGTYTIEVDIYRLVALEGTAKLERGILKFIDEAKEIRADIIVNDESATFTVTESKRDNIKSGDIFDFPEKW